MPHSPSTTFPLLSSGSELSAGGRTVISLALRHAQSKQSQQSQPKLDLDLSKHGIKRRSCHDDDGTVARTMHSRGSMPPLSPILIRSALDAINATPTRCEKRERVASMVSDEPPAPPKTLRTLARARVRRDLVLNEDILTFHTGFRQPTALIAGES